VSIQPTAARLLTVAEYLAIGEVEHGYSELVEGRLVMSPSPSPLHNLASWEICLALRRQLPADLLTVQDVDVDLELAEADAPGFVRRPDIVVVHRDVPRRIQREGGMIRASDVLVVVELVSPSSRRTDHVIKRGEYADAGIAHYWIVDLAEPVSLLACHLAGEFGYVDGAAATGTFTTTTTTPFAVEIDLSALG
jgi:Uma2 family endonuclease